MSFCSLIIFVNAIALAGVCEAGFKTIALPKAIAGADFQAAIAMGKFQGDIIPQTPTGSRVISTEISSRVEAIFSPNCLRALAA